MVDLCCKTSFIADIIKTIYSYVILTRNIIFLNLPVFQLLFMTCMGIVAILFVNLLTVMTGSSSQSLVINYQLTRCQQLAENGPHRTYARNLKCQ
jgi:hypothetical protein